MFAARGDSSCPAISFSHGMCIIYSIRCVFVVVAQRAHRQHRRRWCGRYDKDNAGKRGHRRWAQDANSSSAIYGGTATADSKGLTAHAPLLHAAHDKPGINAPHSHGWLACQSPPLQRRFLRSAHNAKQFTTHFNAAFFARVCYRSAYARFHVKGNN